MDRFFKLERAREEIERLNVKIPRVITYMRDEEQYLRRKEQEASAVDTRLAYQIRLHRLQRERFNTEHRRRFRELTDLPGFTGSIAPGTRKLNGRDDGWESTVVDAVGTVGGESAATDGVVVDGAGAGDEALNEEDTQDAEEQAHQEEQEGVLQFLEYLLQVSND